MLKAGDKARGRAISALGLAAVALGVVGLIAARGIDFAARTGAQFGWSNGELKVAWFNPFSALLTIILGAVAIGGAFTGKRLLVMISAGVFALMTLEVVLRWRNGTGSMLGGTGANIALWGLFAVGLFVCARPGRQDVPDAA